MLYAFDDPKFWGKQFKMAAARLGRDCTLFRDPREVPPRSRAFVRLDQEADQRQQSKGMVSALHARSVTTLPTAAEALWYDDKVLQYPMLRDWLPPTAIVRKAEDAPTILRGVDFPFISKAADSSASKAVRLVNNPHEAQIEIIRAFGDGIPSAYGRIQQGYLYWQKFMPNNSCDYRIVVMHNKVMGLIRFNRKDPARPFASGSGDHAPIMDFTDDLSYKAARICLIASYILKTNWMAYDVVFGPAGEPFILEMSSSWTPYSYTHCPLFTYVDADPFTNDFIFSKTYDNGGHMFECAVEALLELPPT